MKRTYWLAEMNHDEHNTFDAPRKITCEVVGEWSDKSKIWQDENGNQYFCSRFSGINYFFKA